MPDMKIQMEDGNSSRAVLGPCVKLFMELLLELEESESDKSRTASPIEKGPSSIALFASHLGTGDGANTHKPRTESFD
jgi:hypothetical protein